MLSQFYQHFPVIWLPIWASTATIAKLNGICSRRVAHRQSTKGKQFPMALSQLLRRSASLNRSFSSGERIFLKFRQFPVTMWNLTMKTYGNLVSEINTEYLEKAREKCANATSFHGYTLRIHTRREDESIPADRCEERRVPQLRWECLAVIYSRVMHELFPSVGGCWAPTRVLAHLLPELEIIY